MADFDDELNGYLHARTVSDRKEQEEAAAANAGADALFGPTAVAAVAAAAAADLTSSATTASPSSASSSSFPFPHPKEYEPTQEAPAFAFSSVSQLWHDANMGTYSYYDAASETYVPVEAPGSSHLHHRQHHHYQQQQQQHAFPTADLSYDFPNTVQYHIDPTTGYAIDKQSGHHDMTLATAAAPPESDATLRLCVLSSNILKVGGVIMMDGSGLSFGRDRPLSGQGNRVRMVEMEISRFHASIYLDRQQQQQQQEQEPHEEEMEMNYIRGQVQEHKHHHKEVHKSEEEHEESNVQEAEASMKEQENIPSVSSPGMEQPSDVIDGQVRLEDDKEDGELPDSPGADSASKARRSNQIQQNESDETREEGEESDDPSVTSEKLHHHHRQRHDQQQQYHGHQWQMDGFQHYYYHHHSNSSVMTPPVYVDTFQITDCGSTHGTFLNGERLSAPKMASQPFMLKHLDKLQIGTTTLEVHIHEEGRICGTCQVTDGNEIEVLDDKSGVREGSTTATGKNGGTESSGRSSPMLVGDIKLLREQERIEEMNRLRKKWAGPDNKKTVLYGNNTKRGGAVAGLHGAGGTAAAVVGEQHSTDYVDRAAKRRFYNPERPGLVPGYNNHGSQVEVAVDSNTSGFHVPVAKTNKGHAMLSKMGWKSGTGLGAAGQGVVEPVQLMVTENKAGLGSGKLQSQGTAATRVAETPAEKARRKARERYAQLK
ncbi:Angiogenic factor with G patch and FHA domains 1 [Mortierella claussenii]|nr:Angiogenic factor with G patch and FHA domains 1 [Mortierella claussenii]